MPLDVDEDFEVIAIFHFIFQEFNASDEVKIPELFGPIIIDP